MVGVCGGGLLKSKQVFPEQRNATKRPIKPTLIEETAEEEMGLCIDRPNWSPDLVYQYLTCDSYGWRTKVDNTSKEILRTSCEELGHLQSATFLSANEACCICGGGYSGELIGRTFRVTFPADADAFFTLFTNPNQTTKNGTTVYFMNDVANTTGFGMYEVELSEKAQLDYPNDTYAACRVDLILGNTDICIGPFWNYGDVDFDDDTDDEVSNYSVSSEVLFEDQFYLIVRKTDQSLAHRLVTPILPFTTDAWFWLAFTVIYCVAIFTAITGDLSNWTKGTWLENISNLSFWSVQSFTAGELGNGEPENKDCARRWLIAGFGIFGLIVLTAYTGLSSIFTCCYFYW